MSIESKTFQEIIVVCVIENSYFNLFIILRNQYSIHFILIIYLRLSATKFV